MAIERLQRFGVPVVLLSCVLVLLACAPDSWTDESAEAAARESADLAIERVTVIDALSPPRPDHRVVVRGDRIVWVGPTDDPGAPPARRAIDGRGRFLIPGLWDAHVHFVYDEALTDAMPDLFLDHGITSVRDTGGDLATLTALREGWRRSGRATPRIFLAGPLLDGAPHVYDGATAEQPPLGVPVATPEAARARIAVAKAAGADFVKVYELVRPEVFDALVEAARAAGLPIASHVPLSMLADVAGPRVDSMEHLRNVELACAADADARLAARRARLAAWTGARGHPLRKALHDEQRHPAIAAFDGPRCERVLEALRGTLQVPTLRLNAFNRARPYRAARWQAAFEGLPIDVASRWREDVADFRSREDRFDLRFSDWSLRLVGLMRDAGVPIGAGTDTPIRLAIPGESLHRELALLVEAGLTPREALAAATIEPARFFGLEDEMGRIAPDHRADLVLLAADPLASIDHTRSIEGVLAAGRWVRAPRR